MKTCPNCNFKLSIFKIKNKFECENCNALLKSNTTFSSLFPLILGGFFATSISEWIFEEDIYKYVLDFAIVLVFFIILWSVLLKVRQDD